MPDQNLALIQQIINGEEHQLNLTREGAVYSSGSGNYCNVGLGGSSFAKQSTIMKSLADKRVV